VIFASNGLPRDSRGLADEFDFDYNKTCVIEQHSDPCQEILKEIKNESLERLVKAIESIERFDVLDDVAVELQRDLMADSNSMTTGTSTSAAQLHLQQMIHRNPDDKITLDDSLTYDAYVCYADEDKEFVLELTRFLEKNGVKLVIRDRDLLAGTLEYDSFTRLLTNHCKRMIVVLSPSFLKSKECDFQTKFATSLGVEQRARIMIPVVIASCQNLPPTIKMLTKIDFCSRNTLEWSWNKLLVSVRDENRSDFKSNVKSSVKSSVESSMKSGSQGNTQTESKGKKKNKLMN